MSENTSLLNIAQEVDPNLSIESGEASPLRDLLKKRDPTLLVSKENVKKVLSILQSVQDIGLRTIRNYPDKYYENVLAIKIQILKIIESATSTPDPEIQA